MQQSVFFVGTPEEVAHHAAPMTDLEYQVVSPAEIVQVAQPGDLAIFYSEHFDRFREAIRQLKSKNVATLYMIDGILEWRNAWENRSDEPACPWTMRPVLSDKVACIGPSQARVLSAWGNADKVEIVGIPRLDALSDVDSNRETSSEFHLLVMTAKWPGFTEAQINNAVRALIDVKTFLAENPVIGDRSVKVTWRLTQNLHEQVGVENQLTDLTGNDMVSTLLNVDAVITTPSTAILEAMLLGRPVATLDYNNCPKYVPTSWAITASTHCQSVLEQLADPPEVKLFHQQIILADALASGGSARRMTELARSMLAISRESIENAQPLGFPANLVSWNFTGVSPDFDHAKIFADCAEFQNDDRRQLQSELGHARREIEHLHGQIAQLKSELQQAHEIFEQIQRHPVAGPVVRARQKLLDWFARFASRKNNSVKSSPVEKRTPAQSKSSL